MAVIHEAFGTLVGNVARMPVLSALALISLAMLYSSLRNRRPNLSHIPVLGVELGFKGRKAEYARNASEFLQRGYLEVSFYSCARPQIQRDMPNEQL